MVGLSYGDRDTGLAALLNPVPTDKVPTPHLQGKQERLLGKSRMRVLG